MSEQKLHDNTVVDVNIMGREFTVACTEEERPSLLEAVHFLDQKMRDIRDTGKIVSIERIAIMAALNLSHELLNSKNGNIDIGAYRRQIAHMQNQIDAELSA